MAWYNWSQTASSNASADPTVNWAEGQAPSSINDSARAMMAATAKYRDDIAGAIVTSGSSTAYTVASFSVFDTLAHLSGQMIAFTPNATSTNVGGTDVSLNVDGLGAKPLRMQKFVPMPSGTLVAGTPYVAVYNNTDGVFYLQNMTNPYVIPIAAGMDYWAPTAPNSSFAFPIGQAISRTVYASLFSGNPWSIGTTYGAGDGSTTFNLPDKTGRISAMQEASATRLTSTYFGGNSTALGAVGGGESHVLSLGELPTGITSTNSGIALANAAPDVFVNTGTPAGGSAGLQGSNGGATTALAAQDVFTHVTISAQGISTSNNTGGGAHRTVQPTIVCNYIIRII